MKLDRGPGRGARDSRSRDHSAVIVGDDMDALIELANRFAAEHVNLQVRDADAVLSKLRHAGAVFVGPHAPVAAGDYVAGPSHCLPTNTTARFASGVSVYEFLKRTSVVRYDPLGLPPTPRRIVALADAEGLDGHAASVRVRTTDHPAQAATADDLEWFASSRHCEVREASAYRSKTLGPRCPRLRRLFAASTIRSAPGRTTSGFRSAVAASATRFGTLARMAPKFVRETVRGMDGYTPGEQPGAADRVVKLNTNENPFPPSPKVMAAVRDVEAECLRRYPNPTGDAFRARRGQGVRPLADHFLCGNGSDDILTIATRTFVPPGGTIAYPEPDLLALPGAGPDCRTPAASACRGATGTRCRSRR